MKVNRFTPGAFVGVDQAVRADIAWAGDCPQCSATLAIVRDFQGGTRDVCDCGFSRATPRHVMPVTPPRAKRTHTRSDYCRARYLEKKARRRGEE